MHPPAVKDRQALENSHREELIQPATRRVRCGNPSGGTITATLRSSFLRSPALQPLAFRDFRILSGASTLNSFGMMGETVALGWLVLNMTDSPFMVGVSMALRLAPNFLLGIPAGAIADSADRRRLIRWLNVGMAVPVGTLGLLILSGDARLWHVLALMTVAGGLQS